MATLSLRMQVRHWRFVIWAGMAALAAVAGWNLWQIVQKIQQKKYESRTATHFEQLIGSASGSIDEAEVKVADWKADYEKTLVETPINGHVKEPPKIVQPVEVEPGPPPTKPIHDVLIVTAVTSGPEDLGRIVVKYKDDTVKPTRDDLVLKVGATLVPPYDVAPFNGRLKAINVDSATFDWCGKDVDVHPMRKEDAPGKVASAPAGERGNTFDASLSAADRAVLEKNKAQPKTVSYAPDSYLVGTKDYADLSANAENYLREARITETKDANGKKQVVVGQISPNGYLSQTYGIRSGDGLISINGEPVTSKTQAYSYVREHSDLSKYVVVLSRKGKEVTKTILVNRDNKK